ncbi:MAG: hypothetical protein R2932_42580 [Caldilineaceae bacterium]
MAYPQRYFAANADETLGELLAVANELGKISRTGCHLPGVLEQPAMTSAIIGGTVEQARDNMLPAAGNSKAKHFDRLNKVSALPHRYPRSMEEGMDVGGAMPQ